jgi:murein DD-endopeptidase MepM/ murein hydrolase activator NlpD
MTGKRRFAQFSLILLSLAALPVLACASASPLPTDTPSPVATAPAADPFVLPSPAPVADLTAQGVKVQVSPGATPDGSIVIVSVTLPKSDEGKPSPVVNGEFEGITLPFYEDGESRHSAVLGVPYDHKPGNVAVRVKIGQGPADKNALIIEAPFVIQSAQYSSETLKVQKGKVQPTDPKVLARSAREKAEVGKAYATVTPRKFWDGPFGLPLQSSFTSRYGTRRIYNGVQNSAHLGLDFKAAIGTPIHAPAPGRVALAKDLFFTGNTVILDHGYGVLTVYAHMSKLQVKLGDEIKQGQTLGLSGMTGRVTGPHLHWMAVIHKQKVNPQFLTQVMK